jgi:hypothetical protein|tara:strand:- start:1707 stop:2093 length:387 start_codon:yes stop_codon:yes gene_type:complete
MAVTTDNIRDLLNRPRGLVEGAISEYISLRTTQVDQIARNANYILPETAVTTAEKEVAIKMLVCTDCLLILIDTTPTFYPEKERGEQDRRFQSQLKVFEKRAKDALDMISEKAGAAFATGNSKSRITS